MALTRLYTRYKEHPARTIGQLRQICGSVLAPYIILDYTPLEATPMAYATGSDLELLEAWAQRWELVRWMTDPVGPTWRALCMHARHTVYAWYHDLGRAEMVAKLATCLLDVGMLDGHTWQRLVRHHTSNHLRQKDKERRARIP
jgi:hypothetical protein